MIGLIERPVKASSRSKLKVQFPEAQLLNTIRVPEQRHKEMQGVSRLNYHLKGQDNDGKE